MIFQSKSNGKIILKFLILLLFLLIIECKRHRKSDRILHKHKGYKRSKFLRLQEDPLFESSTPTDSTEIGSQLNLDSSGDVIEQPSGSSLSTLDYNNDGSATNSNSFSDGTYGTNYGVGTGSSAETGMSQTGSYLNDGSSSGGSSSNTMSNNYNIGESSGFNQYKPGGSSMSSSGSNGYGEHSTGGGSSSDSWDSISSHGGSTSGTGGSKENNEFMHQPQSMSESDSETPSSGGSNAASSGGSNAASSGGSNAASSGGSSAPSSGGSSAPSSGGSSAPSSGGSSAPSSGGSSAPSSGGSSAPSSGGSSAPSSGGSSAPSSGGVPSKTPTSGSPKPGAYKNKGNNVNNKPPGGVPSVSGVQAAAELPNGESSTGSTESGSPGESDSSGSAAESQGNGNPGSGQSIYSGSSGSTSGSNTPTTSGNDTHININGTANSSAGICSSCGCNDCNTIEINLPLACMRCPQCLNCTGGQTPCIEPGCPSGNLTIPTGECIVEKIFHQCCNTFLANLNEIPPCEVFNTNNCKIGNMKLHNNKAMNYLVYLQTTEQYDEQFNKINSEKAEKLRDKIRNFFLRVYADNDFFLDVFGIKFSELDGFVCAKILIRFTKEVKGNIHLLFKAIMCDCGCYLFKASSLKIDVANITDFIEFCPKKCKYPSKECLNPKTSNCDPSCCIAMPIPMSSLPQMIPSFDLQPFSFMPLPPPPPMPSSNYPLFCDPKCSVYCSQMCPQMCCNNQFTFKRSQLGAQPQGRYTPVNFFQQNPVF